MPSFDGDNLTDSVFSLNGPLDGFRNIFPARITAVSSGSGAYSGFFVYSWIEQQFDSSTGVYSNVLGGRQGTSTLSPAFELNNDGTVSIGTLVWMRFKGTVTNNEIWEFVNPAGGGSGGSGVVTIQGVVDGSSIPTTTGTTYTQTPTTVTFDATSGIYVSAMVGSTVEIRGIAAGLSQSGIVTTGLQSFAGAKTFSSSAALVTTTFWDTTSNFTVSQYSAHTDHVTFSPSIVAGSPSYNEWTWAVSIFDSGGTSYNQSITSDPKNGAFILTQNLASFPIPPHFSVSNGTTQYDGGTGTGAAGDTFKGGLWISAGTPAIFIGETITGATLGSVLFAGAGSVVLAQDNANYFWDETNKRLGILNNSPSSTIDIGLAGTTTGTFRMQGSTSGYFQQQPANAAGSWILTWPIGAGTSGQVLTTNGSGVTSWVTAAVGTVTSVAFSGGTTGFTVTGSPITTSGTITLTGTLIVANGGTGDTTFTAYSVLCAGTTATGAFQNVSGLGTSGQILTSQGAGTLPIWASPATSGTVISVNGSGGTTGLTISGGPITTTGTLTLGGTLIVANGGTGIATTTAYGVIVGGTTATGAFQNAGTGTTGQIFTSNGSSALPTWQTVSGTGTVTSVAFSGGSTGFTVTGSPITTSGTITLTGTLIVANGGTGNTTFTAYSLICAGTTATGTFQNVSGVGTSGQLLTSGGAGALPTWQSPATSGTVTSVTFTGDGTVLSSTPSSAVTVSGTLTASLNSQSANKVLAGPTSGGAVNPTFRLLVGSDLPNPSSTTLGGIESLAAVTSNWINAISTSGVPSATQPAFTDISGTAVVNQGGTGNTTFTAYSLICAGTTSTGAFQNVSGVGTTGQVLTSAGAGALPTWQTVSGTGTVTSITAGTGLTGGTITVSGTIALSIPVIVTSGGTGLITLTTAYGLVAAGTTATGALQNAGTGTSGQVYISGGSSSLGTWELVPNASLANSSITITAGTGLANGGVVSLGGSVTVSLTIPVVVSSGGTGVTSVPAYAVLVGGTTSTGALQTVASGTVGQVLTYQGSSSLPTWTTVGGTGTVTSIGMTVPGYLTVTPSTITTNGTFAITSLAQSANTVLAGPTSGSTATPNFRALVVADINTIAVTSLTTSDGSLTESASVGTVDLAINTGHTNTFSVVENFDGGLTAGGSGKFTVSNIGNITKINNVVYSFPASQAGAGGYTLFNDGSGNLTWGSPSGGAGTVTSITAAAGIILTPNPITTTGTVAVDQTYAFNLTAIITMSGQVFCPPKTLADASSIVWGSATGAQVVAFSPTTGHQLLHPSSALQNGAIYTAIITAPSGTPALTFDSNFKGANPDVVASQVNIRQWVSDGTNLYSLFPTGIPNSSLVNSSVTITAGTALSGGGAVSLGGSITINCTAVTSVDGSGGTTGLTVSGGPITSSGTLTLGGTLIVSNGGTGLTTITNHAVLLGAGTSAVNTVSGLGTSGFVLTSQGAAADPIWAAGSGGTVTSVNGSGGTTGLTLTGGPITSTGTLTIGGVLIVANGGTGLSTLSTAYGLVAAGTTPTGALQNAGTGSSGQVYISGGSSSLGTWELVPNASLANSSLTVTAGTGLTGGGSVSLGGSVTISLIVPVTFSDGGTNNTAGYANGVIPYSDGSKLTSTSLLKWDNTNSAVYVIGALLGSDASSQDRKYRVTDSTTDLTDSHIAAVNSSGESFTFASMLVKSGDGSGNNPPTIGLANLNSAGHYILGSYVAVVMTTTTAGSEVQDLVFYTQTAGSTASEQFRVKGSGVWQGVHYGVGVALFDSSGNVSSGTVPNSGLTNSSLTVTAGTGLTGGGLVSLGGSTTLSLGIPVVVSSGGTGIVTATAHGVLLGNGTSAFNVSGAGTAGQVLTSNGASADPTFQTPSTTGTVTSISAGTGITLTPNPIIATGSVALTVPVIVTSGGTGLVTFTTAYGLIAAGTTATGALQNAGTGTSGQVYISGGASSLGTWELVPNASLANSSLTVTAGTGLTGGGSVSLGGSTSVAIDFTRSDTWTGLHHFQAGLDVGSSDQLTIDTSGNLVTSGSGKFAGNTVQLGVGGGSGIARFGTVAPSSIKGFEFTAFVFSDLLNSMWMVTDTSFGIGGLILSATTPVSWSPTDPIGSTSDVFLVRSASSELTIIDRQPFSVGYKTGTMLANLKPEFVFKSASYTLTDADGTVVFTASGQTATLPDATTRLRRIFAVKNSSSGTCILTTTSSQTIFWTTAVTSITLQIGDSYLVQSDGSNWQVVSDAISVASLGAVPSTRLVNAGAGLTGGGALSADITISLAIPVSLADGGTNNTAGYANGVIPYSDGSKLTSTNSLKWDNTNAASYVIGSVLGADASSQDKKYRTTDSGGDNTDAKIVAVNSSGGSFAFALSLIKSGDGAGNNPPTIGFANRNSSSHYILGSYIACIPSNVTAGSEVQDLVFYTQTAGTLATEGFRIKGSKVWQGAGYGLGVALFDASGNVSSGTVPNSGLTNNSITIIAGAGLTGGGTVALGGSETTAIDFTRTNSWTGTQNFAQTFTKIGPTINAGHPDWGITPNNDTIVQVVIINGGTSGTYAVNDVLTVVGGLGTAATLKVTAASANLVTGITILTPGSYSTLPLNYAHVTGGGGGGATFCLISNNTLSFDNVFGFARVQAIQGGTDSSITVPAAVYPIGDFGTTSLALGPFANIYTLQGSASPFSNTLTVVTRQAHGFNDGDVVGLTGLIGTYAAYNFASYTLHLVNATTFQVNLAQAGQTTSAFGPLATLGGVEDVGGGGGLGVQVNLEGDGQLRTVFKPAVRAGLAAILCDQLQESRIANFGTLDTSYGTSIGILFDRITGIGGGTMSTGCILDNVSLQGHVSCLQIGGLYGVSELVAQRCNFNSGYGSLPPGVDVRVEGGQDTLNIQLVSNGYNNALWGVYSQSGAGSVYVLGGETSGCGEDVYMQGPGCYTIANLRHEVGNLPGFGVIHYNGNSVADGNLTIINSQMQPFDRTLLEATVQAGGSSYLVGDTLTVVGGTGTAATLHVDTISGSGGVLTAHFLTPGIYTVLPVPNAFTPASVTGGAGTGAAFFLQFPVMSILRAAVTATGASYTAGDQITVLGGNGTFPVFQVDSVTSGAINSVSVVSPGAFFSLPANPASVSGGTGHSATLTLTAVPKPGLYLTGAWHVVVQSSNISGAINVSQGSGAISSSLTCEGTTFYPAFTTNTTGFSFISATGGSSGIQITTDGCNKADGFQGIGPIPNANWTVPNGQFNLTLLPGWQVIPRGPYFNSNVPETEANFDFAVGGAIPVGNIDAVNWPYMSGLMYIPTCPGTPVGTAEGVTGCSPILIDSVNNLLYFYTNAAWHTSSGGMAIGGTVTSGTPGSILFIGATGVLAQDNAHLFWDDANLRMDLTAAIQFTNGADSFLALDRTLGVHSNGFLYLQGSASGGLWISSSSSRNNNFVLRDTTNLAQIYTNGTMQVQVDGSGIVSLFGYGAGFAKFSSGGVVSSFDLFGTANTWTALNTFQAGATVGTTNPVKITDKYIKLYNGSNLTVQISGYDPATAFSGMVELSRDSQILFSTNDPISGSPDCGINRYTTNTLIVNNGSNAAGNLALAQLWLFGSSGGIVTVLSVSGTWTLTVPTTAGTAGQFLQTDGTGVTTWATLATATTTDWNYHMDAGTSIGGTTAGTAGKRWHLASIKTGAVLGTQVLIPNELYALEFKSSAGRTINNLAMGLNSGTVTGKNLRIGIYQAISSSDKYPGALVYDSGSISLTGAATPSMVVKTSVAQALDPTKLYYLACITDFGNTFQFTNSSDQVGCGTEVIGYGDNGTAFSADGGIGFSVSQSYGTLPNPYPSGATVIGSTSDQIPCIGAQLT